MQPLSTRSSHCLKGSLSALRAGAKTRPTRLCSLTSGSSNTLSMLWCFSQLLGDWLAVLLQPLGPAGIQCPLP